MGSKLSDSLIKKPTTWSVRFKLQGTGKKKTYPTFHHRHLVSASSGRKSMSYKYDSLEPFSVWCLGNLANGIKDLCLSVCIEGRCLFQETKGAVS